MTEYEKNPFSVTKGFSDWPVSPYFPLLDQTQCPGTIAAFPKFPQARSQPMHSRPSSVAARQFTCGRRIPNWMRWLALPIPLACLTGSSEQQLDFLRKHTDGIYGHAIPNSLRGCLPHCLDIMPSFPKSFQRSGNTGDGGRIGQKT